VVQKVFERRIEEKKLYYLYFLHLDALEILKQWKAMKQGSDLLFTILKGEKINTRYVRALVERKANQAGIEKDIHPHTLRHTFATDIYRKSKNLRMVQKALGHSSIQITEFYTHIIDEELEQGMRFFRKVSVA
jgi:integrase/recombinase XerD